MDLNKKTKVRTIHQLVSDIYRNQRAASKRRNMELPNYTNKQLQNWVSNQPLFETLYNRWIASGCVSRFVPSLDRIDDYVSYTLSNLEVMTWGDNLNRSYQARRNGVNNKVSIPVVGEHLITGHKVKFYSMAQASRIMGCSKGEISQVCNGKAKSADGYKWSII